MPNHKVGDLTTEGRYTQVSWRRDEHEPGYVQVSTQGPGTQGAEFVHHDADGVDELIKTLHKAKRQAFGEPKPAIVPPSTWRIIGDQPDIDTVAFIPTDRPERAQRIAERVAQMTPADMAAVAAKWLAENHPDDPHLAAYREASDG